MASGPSPGDKTRILRISLATIAVSLALLLALVVATDGGSRTAEGGARPESTGPGSTASDTDDGGDAAPDAAPRLYVVIDDVGNTLNDLDPYLSLSLPLTFAVLPQLDYSREAARRIAAAGQETILHLPMEAQSGKHPGPGTIFVDDPPEQVSRTLEANFKSVPGAKGMNNHMGSRATADEKTMERTLAFAQERGLFFLDSRTTADTVVVDVAARLDVPVLERHVFLDNEREAAAIRAALYQGVDLAKRRGYAILIGHATDGELAEVLRQEVQSLKQAGIVFDHLSRLIAK